jgi:alkanesulfonate monooxygenase SsuD/methylene tetrahydromethanopterin reductase-like flavin-dependent oxidoreductase (luciferase family)
VPPLGGTPSEIAAGLRAFAHAGADETILVVDPIDEDAVAELGEMLKLLDES